MRDESVNLGTKTMVGTRSSKERVFYMFSLFLNSRRSSGTAYPVSTQQKKSQCKGQIGERPVRRREVRALGYTGRLDDHGYFLYNDDLENTDSSTVKTL